MMVHGSLIDSCQEEEEEKEGHHGCMGQGRLFFGMEGRVYRKCAPLHFLFLNPERENWFQGSPKAGHPWLSLWKNLSIGEGSQMVPGGADEDHKKGW